MWTPSVLPCQGLSVVMLIFSVRPELVEGRIRKFAWFDRLTTNGFPNNRKTLPVRLFLLKGC